MADAAAEGGIGIGEELAGLAVGNRVLGPSVEELGEG
jgi:hypothetical protein